MIKPTTRLHHLTLTTGHVARTTRAEVRSAVIMSLAPLAQSGGGTVPCFGWNVEVRRPQPHSTEALCNGAASFIVHDAVRAPLMPSPLVRCVVCWQAERSNDAWDLAKQAAQDSRLPTTASIRQPREVPWLAVMLCPGIMDLSPVAIAALGDFERCFAWTLIESAESTDLLPHSPTSGTLHRPYVGK